MKILGGVEEHLWVQSPQQFNVRRGSPEHPLGMEWVGTEANSRCRSAAPVSLRLTVWLQEQTGREGTGMLEGEQQGGSNCNRVSRTYFPGGDAEAPEALGLLGCSLCQRLAWTQ